MRRNYVGIELADEAREVVVLEISREELGREFRRVPDDEAVIAGGAPGDDGVC